MSEIPDEGGQPVKAVPSGPHRRNAYWPTTFRVLSSTRCPQNRWCELLDSLEFNSPAGSNSRGDDREADEKARRPKAARNLEVGGATARAVGERGSYWRVRVDGMRPEAPAGGRHTSGGAVESSPSAGWRETYDQMGVDPGGYTIPCTCGKVTPESKECRECGPNSGDSE